MISSVIAAGRLAFRGSTTSTCFTIHFEFPSCYFLKPDPMQLYLDLITIIPILAVIWEPITKLIYVKFNQEKKHLQSEAYMQGLLISNFTLHLYQLLYDNDTLFTWVWKNKQVHTHVYMVYVYYTWCTSTDSLQVDRRLMILSKYLLYVAVFSDNLIYKYLYSFANLYSTTDRHPMACNYNRSQKSTQWPFWLNYHSTLNYVSSK